MELVRRSPEGRGTMTSAFKSSKDEHMEDRRALFAELRAAGDDIPLGWYAVHITRLDTYEVYEADDDSVRIRNADGTPIAGGVRAELRAFRRIGINPQASMLLYGQHSGNCGHCNEPLPNVAARARGISPVCAMDMGWTDVVRAG